MSTMSDEMNGSDRFEEGGERIRAVCVTGSTGYIGSWLVNSLLGRGYTVHATARDLDKTSQLQSWWGGADVRLKVFRADMDEEGSFDEAVKGCVGVFHVAASMEFNVSIEDGDIDDHARSKIIEPAVRGTINLLQSCKRAGTVKRVVFTSSISTITAIDESGSWKSVVDESSATPMELIWKTKPSGWVYVLSKLLTEESAFKFAKESGIDMVSILPTTVAGPFLTPIVPASVQVLLSPITGDPQLYSILLAVHTRLGSISLVHIEDICDAHIFLMEKAAAEGRYICTAGSRVIPQLADMLALEYPPFNPERLNSEFHNSVPSVISSKRLTDLGFEFKKGIKDVVRESVVCTMERGFLNNPSSGKN